MNTSKYATSIMMITNSSYDKDSRNALGSIFGGYAIKQ